LRSRITERSVVTSDKWDDGRWGDEQHWIIVERFGDCG